MFAAILKCGTCGRPMSRISWKKKDDTSTYRMYCSTYKRFGKNYCTPHGILFEDLEQIVLNDLKTMIHNINSLDRLAMKQMSAHVEVVSDSKCLPKLYEEQRKFTRLKKSVYEDYIENLLSKEEYIAYRNEYLQKEEMLSKQIAILEEPVADMSKNIADYPWVSKLLEMKTVEELDRTIIVEMINEIIVMRIGKLKLSITFQMKWHVYFQMM